MEHYVSKDKWCVYVHVNKINSKIYIGITQNTRTRWKDGKGYTKACRHFYYAIQKYGWNNFEHIILLTDLDKQMANLIEIELIKKYNANNKNVGYNIANGGYGVPLTGKNNPFSIPVYQYDLSGKFIKEWENATIVNRELGIDNTEIGYAAKSPGTRHAGKFLWSYEKHDAIDVFRDFRGLYSKLYQIDLDGNLIHIYNNLHELDKSKIDKVRDCCKGISLTAYNSIWMFENDYNEENVKIAVSKNKNKNSNNWKPVRMYSLDGNYIKTFNNVQEAAEETHLQYGAISVACRSKSHRSDKYLWYYEEDTRDIKINAWKNGIKKPVYQFDLNGNFVCSFNSKMEAENEYGKNIGNVINKNHKAYGFIWVYQYQYLELKDKLNLQDL